MRIIEETEAEDGIYVLQLPADFDMETNDMGLVFDEHSQSVEEFVEASEVEDENAIIEVDILMNFFELLYNFY